MPRKKITYQAPDGKKYSTVLDVPEGASDQDISDALDTHWMTQYAPKAGQAPQVMPKEKEVVGFQGNNPRYSSEDLAARSGVTPQEDQKGEALGKEGAIFGTSALAGGALGELLDAVPFLTSSSRAINAGLGAAKGVAVSEGTYRLSNLLRGEKQPDLTDPTSLVNDAIGGTMGVLGGFFRAPQPPAKPGVSAEFENAQKAYSQWKAQDDALKAAHSDVTKQYRLANKEAGRVGDLVRDQEGVINEAKKNAKTSGSQLFHQQQAKFRTSINQKNAEIDEARQRVINLQDELDKLNRENTVASKNETGRNLNNIEDEILKLENENDSLRGNTFDPDEKKVQAFKEQIAKHRTNEMKLSGGAKTGATRRRIEAEKALEDYLSPFRADEEENANQLSSNLARLRELRTIKGQIRGGRTDIIPTDNDLEKGQRIINLQKELEDAQKAHFNLKMDRNALRVSQAQHAEGVGRVAEPDIDMVEANKRLNDLNDRRDSVKDTAYELYRKQQELDHQKTLSQINKPAVPKEPKAGDKIIDIAKRLGLKSVGAGGVPGTLVATGLNQFAHVPWPLASAVGSGVGVGMGAVANSPTGQEILRQVPKAIPIVPESVKISKKALKDLLGL